jgi:CrcB protein
MKLLGYVFVGAGIGGAARYAMATFVDDRLAPTFPLATFLINVIGSFVLGVIMRLALHGDAVNAETRALFATGFCGGFTTFSTFSYETARMLETRDYRRAATYVGSSVVIAIAATFIGFAVADQLLGMFSARTR